MNQIHQGTIAFNMNKRYALEYKGYWLSAYCPCHGFAVAYGTYQWAKKHKAMLPLAQLVDINFTIGLKFCHIDANPKMIAGWMNSESMRRIA